MHCKIFNDKSEDTIYCDDVDCVPIGEELTTDIVDYEAGPER